MNAIQWMSTICCLPLVYIMGSSFIILHNAFIFNIFIYHVLHNENGPVQCLQNMLNEGHQTKDTSNWDGFWQCLTRQPRNASLLRCRLLFEKHPGDVLTAEGILMACFQRCIPACTSVLKSIEKMPLLYLFGIFTIKYCQVIAELLNYKNLFGFVQARPFYCYNTFQTQW